MVAPESRREIPGSMWDDRSSLKKKKQTGKVLQAESADQSMDSWDMVWYVLVVSFGLKSSNPPHLGISGF